MTVAVIGVDGTNLPPGAADLLRAARLVVGGRRHLDAHAPTGTRRIELGALEPALAELAAFDGPAVVLASGDPGYFGIVRSLRERGLPVAVLPAVSSVQRLAAAVGRSWDDVTVVSAHGRDLRPALNVCRARPAVAVLTAPGSGPAELAAGLAGWRRTLVVAEDFGGPHEQLSTVDLAAAEERSWREPNVVLCLADPELVPARGWFGGGEPVPPDGGWALPEDQFAHRDGMVTKAEVRALALARLAPRPGTLVWDVGAGSGSVAVECARFGAAVVAVERDPAQCERIGANAAAHGVDVRVVRAPAPAGLAGLPGPDAVFVGGGGPDVVSACARVGAARVVVALAAVDRVPHARDALREAGYRVDGCQLSSARFAELPGGATRLAAINPVTLLWGVRKP
ncbi:precorrin-6y C5,15-methyltransferase (decarboxylating) subunit CbiE [Solihabitans fulvus]|uniref:Precorrin-6y C5,15-methyltransferase (Decarboxylating) subunit CbiE n=1 Tax=Solihabitans fulvus TaxID=1892852 RepID=A0A5B2X6K4_9PSEU|nr:precorrin-6y C5,15-methyltransferase (decarboxylating) subunit CbiE [Solihabitans fulvus]KAA2258562.1 precorrin-6y C5,15-methyltransferase (decarboxylating) subunit CbiE [Solihabitans fulvus]